MSSAAVVPSLLSNAGRYRLPSVPQPRLTGLLLAALVAGAGALVVILAVTGMSVATEFGNFVLLAAAVGALAAYCHRRKHPWRLTDSAAIVSVVTLSLLLCGLVSCMGLRLGFPLADPLLASGDALLGFNVSRVANFVATQPALSWLLQLAYNSSGPVCAAAVCWNVLRKDRLLLWQVVATLVVAMQITAIVSILFPAQGATVWLGLDALHGNGLPFGAGTYSVAEFAHFYSGSDLLVSREDLNGIVCFPSFHTVLALAILQGFANSPLKWAALPWSALTIVSTIPMGGHYVIDVAGGVLVWIVACSLATWACRFPERGAQAAF
jgi:membrane-associated phospholipid phosphatase